MSFADNLIRSFNAANVVNEDWNTFCDNLGKIADTVRAFEVEGEAVGTIAGALSMGGVPAELIGQMTNEKLATLVDSSVAMMREGGPEKDYLFGMVNERGTLDLYLFHSVNGKTESVTAPLPNFGTENAAQIMMTVWINKNIERYAKQRNAIVLSDVTNFMCGC